MIVGVLIGVCAGKDLPETIFKKTMASIILIAVVIMLWRDLRKDKSVPSHPSFAVIMGLTAGFTTMIGNLAGAFSNMYFLAYKMLKNEFIGTAAWLYLLINVFKLPFHIWSWETINSSNIILIFYLMPVTIVGFFIGTRIIHKFTDLFFRRFILVVTAIGAITLFFK